MDKLTPEDIKLLEEIKRHPNLYEALKDQPEYLVDKINKIIKAFYS